MKFFGRFVFLCNLCFILSAILRLVEIAQKAKGKSEALGFQPLISTLVILGYGAILVNIFFVVLFLFRYPTKKMNYLPRYIVFFNVVMLPVQFYYFFFSKF